MRLICFFCRRWLRVDVVCSLRDARALTQRVCVCAWRARPVWVQAWGLFFRWLPWDLSLNLLFSPLAHSRDGVLQPAQRGGGRSPAELGDVLVVVVVVVADVK